MNILNYKIICKWNADFWERPTNLPKNAQNNIMTIIVPPINSIIIFVKEFTHQLKPMYDFLAKVRKFYIEPDEN